MQRTAITTGFIILALAVTAAAQENEGVHTKDDREIDLEKTNPITVELGFVNTNPDGVKVLVIALFEDTNGNPLARVECAKVNANSDRLKESNQKFKVAGIVLQAMRRVYLFCEVE
jgi:F0F1-type ATP synthase epsilon subunit